MNIRTQTLEAARDLLNGDRQDDYGPPEVNFRRISTGWQVILGADVSPEQVALCMAWLKIARLANGPHGDSYIDGAAYLAIASELAQTPQEAT